MSILLTSQQEQELADFTRMWADLGRRPTAEEFKVEWLQKSPLDIFAYIALGHADVQTLGPKIGVDPADLKRITNLMLEYRAATDTGYGKDISHDPNVFPDSICEALVPVVMDLIDKRNTYPQLPIPLGSLPPVSKNSTTVESLLTRFYHTAADYRKQGIPNLREYLQRYARLQRTIVVRNGSLLGKCISPSSDESHVNAMLAVAEMMGVRWTLYLKGLLLLAPSAPRIPTVDTDPLYELKNYLEEYVWRTVNSYWISDDSLEKIIEKAKHDTAVESAVDKELAYRSMDNWASPFKGAAGEIGTIFQTIFHLSWMKSKNIQAKRELLAFFAAPTWEGLGNLPVLLSRLDQTVSGSQLHILLKKVEEIDPAILQQRVPIDDWFISDVEGCWHIGRQNYAKRSEASSQMPQQIDQMADFLTRESAVLGNERYTGGIVTDDKRKFVLSRFVGIVSDPTLAATLSLAMQKRVDHDNSLPAVLNNAIRGFLRSIAAKKFGNEQVLLSERKKLASSLMDKTLTRHIVLRLFYLMGITYTGTIPDVVENPYKYASIVTKPIKDTLNQQHVCYALKAEEYRVKHGVHPWDTVRNEIEGGSNFGLEAALNHIAAFPEPTANFYELLLYPVLSEQEMKDTIDGMDGHYSYESHLTVAKALGALSYLGGVSINTLLTTDCSDNEGLKTPLAAHCYERIKAHSNGRTIKPLKAPVANVAALKTRQAIDATLKAFVARLFNPETYLQPMVLKDRSAIREALVPILNAYSVGEIPVGSADWKYVVKAAMALDTAIGSSYTKDIVGIGHLGSITNLGVLPLKDVAPEGTTRRMCLAVRESEATPTIVIDSIYKRLIKGESVSAVEKALLCNYEAANSLLLLTKKERQLAWALKSIVTALYEGRWFNTDGDAHKIDLRDRLLRTLATTPFDTVLFYGNEYHKIQISDLIPLLDILPIPVQQRDNIRLILNDTIQTYNPDLRGLITGALEDRVARTKPLVGLSKDDVDTVALSLVAIDRGVEDAQAIQHATEHFPSVLHTGGAALRDLVTAICDVRHRLGKDSAMPTPISETTMTPTPAAPAAQTPEPPKVVDAQAPRRPTEEGALDRNHPTEVMLSHLGRVLTQKLSQMVGTSATTSEERKRLRVHIRGLFRPLLQMDPAKVRSSDVMTYLQGIRGGFETLFGPILGDDPNDVKLLELLNLAQNTMLNGISGNSYDIVSVEIPALFAKPLGFFGDEAAFLCRYLNGLPPWFLDNHYQMSQDSVKRIRDSFRVLAKDLLPSAQAASNEVHANRRYALVGLYDQFTDKDRPSSVFSLPSGLTKEMLILELLFQQTMLNAYPINRNRDLYVRGIAAFLSGLGGLPVPTNDIPVVNELYQAGLVYYKEDKSNDHELLNLAKTPAVLEYIGRVAAWLTDCILATDTAKDVLRNETDAIRGGDSYPQMIRSQVVFAIEATFKPYLETAKHDTGPATMAARLVFNMLEKLGFDEEEVSDTLVPKMISVFSNLRAELKGEKIEQAFPGYLSLKEIQAGYGAPPPPEDPAPMMGMGKGPEPKYTATQMAALRIGTRQATRFTKEALVNILAAGQPGEFRKMIATFLDTEAGEGVLKLVAGMLVNQIDPESDIARRMGMELRVDGMTDVGSQLSDVLLDPIRDIIRKLGDQPPPAPVAEPPQMEAPSNVYPFTVDKEKVTA